MSRPGNGSFFGLRSKRGIALLYALIVAALTAMLALAFVVVNRSNLSLVNSLRLQRGAYQAVVSGYNYARMRLETSDRYHTWGLPDSDAEPFGTSTALVLDAPRLQVYEGGYCVVGILDGGQSHFQIYFEPDPSHTQESLHGRFLDDGIQNSPGDPEAWTRAWASDRISYNNLGSSVENGPLTPPGSLRSVAPGAVNLAITGSSGNITRILDVTLRKPNLVDGAVLSGGALALNFDPAGGHLWSVESLDPFDNKVRANGVMAGPASDKLAFGDGSRQRAGEAVSKKTIVLGADITVSRAGEVTAISGGTDLGDGLNDVRERAAASDDSQGTFLPNSSSDAGIPNITPDKLKQPASVRPVAPGRYHFVGPDWVAHWPDADHNEYDWANATFYNGSIPSTDGGTDPIRLASFNFIVLDGNSVEFSGDTRISTASYYGSVYPGLALGYDASAQLTEASMAGIRVQGNLDVQGAVMGAGSIVTTRNESSQSEGNLILGGKSALSVAPDYGVAIYSEGSMTMRPIPDSTADIWKTQPVDWDVFKQALNGYNRYTTGYGGGVDNWLDSELMTWADRRAHVGQNDGAFGETAIRDQLLSDYPAIQAQLVKGYPTAYGDPAVRQMFDQTLAQWQQAGGISLGRHVRLREFLKRASLYKLYGYDERFPNEWLGWSAWSLDLTNGSTDGTTGYYIDSQMRYFAQEAEKNGLSLSAYFEPEATNPFADEKDIDIKGIVYAGKNFLADVDGFSLAIQGALLAREGPLVVTNADEVRSVFDPKYMESLLQDETPTIKELEAVYWSMR